MNDKSKFKNRISPTFFRCWLGGMRSLQTLVTVSLVISLCSCTTSSKQVGEDPFQKRQEIEQASSRDMQANGSGRPTSPETILDENIQPAREGIVRVSATKPTLQQLHSTGAVLPAAVSFSPAEPRTTLMQTGSHQPISERAMIDQLAREYPDEYLFDGGDRNHPIHYDKFHRHGLDTEDTIAEYRDHKGKRHIQSTNRVAVYAPRFAAVRTVSQPISGVAVHKLGGAELTTHGAGLLARTGTAMHLRRLKVDGVRMRSRASGLNGKSSQVGMDQLTPLARNDKLINLFQNLAFVKTGRLKRAEEAQLAKGMQAATAWSRSRFPVIVGGLDALGEIQATFQPQEIVGTDDSHKSPGRLRIVKMADKKSAQSGDVITFTIRYDNLGDRELKNIRIIDNLTPRLEYVDDSATSDRAGRLVVEDNEEGSLVLKFELSEPLKGKTGGVVTFKAKVR